MSRLGGKLAAKQASIIFFFFSFDLLGGKKKNEIRKRLDSFQWSKRRKSNKKELNYSLDGILRVNSWLPFEISFFLLLLLLCSFPLREAKKIKIQVCFIF